MDETRPGGVELRTGPVAAPETPTSPSLELYEWVRRAIPLWNADILAGRRSVHDLITAVNANLPPLPNPTRCDLDECRRQLVALGIIGSSAERHSQEAGAAAGTALAALRVGRWSFRKYFATLASRVGGPPRDTFQSLVLWNASDVEVYLPGCSEPCVRVPSVFPGASGPLTFSDHPGEPLFFGLLKRCFALEAAANALLWPLAEGALAVDDQGALERVDTVTLLLQGVRAEMNGFRQRSEFTADFFMDVLRQYACSWEPDELSTPPSGAHDVEYMVRDLLLGSAISGYDDHVDDLFHVLTPPAQALLHRARASTPLAVRLGQRLGIDLGKALVGMTETELGAVVTLNPWLKVYYALYKANADLSASHWALVYRYLIGPMRQRDRDAIVVSNYQGTGHLRMNEIRQLMSDRGKHVLLPLQPAILAACQAGRP